MMKKSTFGAILAFLFAAAGALKAAAIDHYSREKELDEYERVLLSDDYDDDEDMDEYDADTVYEPIHDESQMDDDDSADDKDEIKF